MGYDRTFEEIEAGVPMSTVRPTGGGAWRRIAVDGSAATITLPAGGGLDLGGIAKGMAVDASLDLLSALTSAASAPSAESRSSEASTAMPFAIPPTSSPPPAGRVICLLYTSPSPRD